jgi:acetylornithine/succinyldiaminopimelate/putrescine aminotransferase
MLSEMVEPVLKGFERHAIVGQARVLGLLLGVSFQHPEGGQDWMVARAVRSFMLQHGAYPICADEEVVVRMYPALTMDENVLRDALEIMEAAIVHVTEHGTPEGDYPTYPTSDYGA